ncbi:MAG: HAD family hydrolase [Lachnospiraceae bacterium]|nr:HAD family hydrolase [Lachnospiraceae bacterium]
MRKGIIFDMDGTLWDSAENVAASWNLALEQSGFDARVTTEDMYNVMGLTMDDIADRLFPFVEGTEREELLEACCIVENDYLAKHGGNIYPNLEQTMWRLLDMDYELYIVSNCQAGYIEAFLKYYNLEDIFSDFTCFGDNKLKKAENIREIFVRNELEAAVYVGDIQGDADSTHAAGLPFIHAAYGFGEVSDCEGKINSLDQLPDVVDSIFDMF